MPTASKPLWGVRSRKGPWGKWLNTGPFHSIDAAQVEAKRFRESGFHASVFAVPKGMTFKNKYDPSDW
jgi:hypothetical protein